MEMECFDARQGERRQMTTYRGVMDRGKRQGQKAEGEGF